MALYAALRVGISHHIAAQYPRTARTSFQTASWRHPAHQGRLKKFNAYFA
ncbi:hypothetical protein [Neisseria elongata]|nr:hypothetical protein [Neisseria elongata]MBM7065264.1 hypothetical protein [Neisseria elongata]